MPDEVKILAIEEGALLEAVAFSDEPTAKNWLAIVDGIDPQKPGGISRRFMPYAQPPYFYLVADVKQFDVLEWGADYFAEHPKAVGSGRFNVRMRSRTYSLVLTITSTEMRLEIEKTVLQALKRQKYLQATPPVRRRIAYTENKAGDT